MSEDKGITYLKSTEETDEGGKEGKEGISKVTCNKEDEDADTIHPPLISGFHLRADQR